VIDGHTLTRYGLATLIADQPDIEVAREADTMTAASRIVADERPDVVTVDGNLPDGDGFALVRELRERHPELGIVMLASRTADDALFMAMDQGASAFVAKTAPVAEVLGAIRHSAVAASSFTAAELALALARRRHVADRLAISPREGEVLRLLGSGLSVPAIAGTMFISRSTAKTYVARLYEKLGVSNRAQALMTALRLGLLQQVLQETA
jgi:DNA-binding NarL/FixJ family response regulator